MSEGAAPTPQIQQTVQPAESPIERRIAQLVAQRKEAEERAESLTANTTALQEQVLRLSEELTQIRSAPAAPKPEPLAGSVSGVDVAKVMDDRLAAWEKKLTDRETVQRNAVNLQRAQANSAMQAKAEFPEVADQNSQLFGVADRLFRSMPELQHAANGPYQAIIMARGLLAGVGQEQTMDPRKTAASTGPMGAVGAPAMDKAGAKKEIEALLAQRNEAIEALQLNKGDTTKNYVTQRKTERRLRELGCTSF
jgi:hypothetical protein